MQESDPAMCRHAEPQAAGRATAGGGTLGTAEGALGGGGGLAGKLSLLSTVSA